MRVPIHHTLAPAKSLNTTISASKTLEHTRPANPNGRTTKNPATPTIQSPAQFSPITEKLISNLYNIPHSDARSLTEPRVKAKNIEIRTAHDFSAEIRYCFMSFFLVRYRSTKARDIWLSRNQSMRRINNCICM